MAYRLRIASSWDRILSQFEPGGELFDLSRRVFGNPEVFFMVQSELTKRWLGIRLAQMGLVLQPRWTYSAAFWQKLLVDSKLVCKCEILSAGELPFLAFDPEVIGRGALLNYTRALEVAGLLSEYCENFPEILKDLEDPNHRWGQSTVAKLWMKCVSKARRPLGWHLHTLATESGKISVLKGFEVVVLGTAFLTVSELRFLAALSRHVEVFHYLLKPADHPGQFLQYDLALEVLRGEGINPLDEDSRHSDPEVKVTSCWGPHREIETAVEDVWDILDSDPKLQPAQIGMVAMDWKDYVPFLGPALEAIDPSQVPGGSPDSLAQKTLLGSLPLDYQLESQDANWEEAFHLMEILLDLAIRLDPKTDLQGGQPETKISVVSQETWTRSSIKRYLAHPWVVKILSLDDSFDWEEWAGLTHFHWGWNGSDVERLSPMISVHASLEEAWERFVGALGRNPVVPLPQWQHLEKYASVMAHLQDLRRRLTPQESKMGCWLDCFAAVIEDFLGERALKTEQKSCLQMIGQSLEFPLEYRPLFCSAQDFAAYARTKLMREGYRPQLLVKGLSLGSLQRLRGIPFDTLVILGMNEKFPREDSVSPEDVLYQGMDEEALTLRRNALSKSAQDCQLWYDLLTAARTRVLIYYQGQDVNSGDTIPASKLVEELIKKRKASTIHTEMYHFFSGVDEGRATHFEKYADIARALTAKRTTDFFEPKTLQELEGFNWSHRAIVRICKHPLREYLQLHLGYHEPWIGEGSDPDEEEWELQPIDYLDHVLGSEDWEQGDVDRQPRDSMAQLFWDLFQKGELGFHRDKEGLPDAKILEALDIYENLWAKLRSERPNVTLKRVRSSFDNRSRYFCQLSHPFDKTYLVLLYETSYSNSDSFQGYESWLEACIYSWICKEHSQPCQYLLTLRDGQFDEIELKIIHDAQHLLYRIADWAMKNPCLIPLHEKNVLEDLRLEKFDLLYSKVKEIAEPKLSYPNPNDRTRQLSNQMFFLLQNKKLPDKTPDWFQDQCREFYRLIAPEET